MTRAKTWNHAVPTYRTPEQHRAIVGKVVGPSEKQKATKAKTKAKQAVAKPAEPKKPRGKRAPSNDRKVEFYASWEWTTLRMKTFMRYGRECMCCGARPGNGVVLNVDHIKPLSKHWELRLDPENLQVLCHPCNKGKGAWDDTDYRPK